ncbi:hypothetical protein RHMOL_Rhmol01G0359400 [Rhododendron molle]|uniref:Uncharacterized protein n=1 Tax=Rhododendron molle TaxID=49168 RepID=A0ACC0QB90_RHOML|nr:hypothetical protein RHMOL_Rhmol01G0359400 [Rhododendron molle]
MEVGWRRWLHFVDGGDVDGGGDEGMGMVEAAAVRMMEELGANSPASWKCSEEYFSQQIKNRDPLKIGFPNVWALRLVRQLLVWDPISVHFHVILTTLSFDYTAKAVTRQNYDPRRKTFTETGEPCASKLQYRSNLGAALRRLLQNHSRYLI